MPEFHHPFIPSVGCPCAVNTLHYWPCPARSALPSQLGLLYSWGSPRVPGRGTLSPASLSSFPGPTRHPSCVRMLHGTQAGGRTMPKFMTLLEFSSLTLGLWLQTPIVRKHQSSLSFHGWDSTLTSSGLLFFEGLYILHGDSMGCPYQLPCRSGPITSPGNPTSAPQHPQNKVGTPSPNPQGPHSPALSLPSASLQGPPLLTSGFPADRILSFPEGTKWLQAFRILASQCSPALEMSPTAQIPAVYPECSQPLAPLNLTIALLRG